MEELDYNLTIVITLIDYFHLSGKELKLYKKNVENLYNFSRKLNNSTLSDITRIEFFSSNVVVVNIVLQKFYIFDVFTF